LDKDSILLFSFAIGVLYSGLLLIPRIKLKVIVDYDCYLLPLH